jgi:hypothetical protein
MNLAFALAGSLVLFAGCSQGEGDRCQINSDCASGLFCAPTGSPGNGICQNSNPGTGGSTGQDAAGPLVTPDASNDVPTVAADAADGESTLDAEAAADSSASD